MTREEAIQILSTRDAHGVLCGYTSGVTEALDMAIEALKADAVSREEYNDLLRTKISFANATIPTFTESAEAYKDWTGEEMGCKSFTADEWYRNTFKDGDDE